MAAAADWECPEVYSGNGGVTSSGVRLGSMRRRMYVTGRSKLYRYLVCQQVDEGVGDGDSALRVRLRGAIE